MGTTCWAGSPVVGAGGTYMERARRRVALIWEWRVDWRSIGMPSACSVLEARRGEARYSGRQKCVRRSVARARDQSCFFRVVQRVYQWGIYLSRSVCLFEDESDHNSL